jgi:hypothetical protein
VDQAGTDAQWQPARKYARALSVFANLAKFGKGFAKLLEHQFFSFAKKTKIVSANAKLLEMLLQNRS